MTVARLEAEMSVDEFNGWIDYITEHAKHTSH